MMTKEQAEARLKELEDERKRIKKVLKAYEVIEAGLDGIVEDNPD